MPDTKIKLKRAYESTSVDDGVRILAERLWPRGVSKANARLDHWAKEVAPSPELRVWFGHHPPRWRQFQVRYRKELEANRSAVNALRERCTGQTVTFVFAAKDEHRNGAVVLKEFLGERI